MATHTPLTPVAFEILVSLATAERHGYAILVDIRDRTGQALRPGSLYRALHRLLEDGLVEETGETRGAPHGGSVDGPTCFRLTQRGRTQAAAEAERLAAQVRHARAARLLDRGRS